MKSIAYISFLILFSFASTLSAQSGLYTSSDSTDILPEPVESASTPASKVDFILHRNFPNPVTGYLTIHYEIKHAGHYVVSVVGTKGREIRKLIDKLLLPGSYKLNWLASPTADGIYMYRLEEGKQAGQRRLLLLKY